MPQNLHKLYIIAGEPSGDVVAAKFLQKLKTLEPNLELYGVGGKEMEAEGLTSLFPMSDLSVMGFMEVLPKVFKIQRRMRQVVEHIVQVKPDVLLTVDSYGFNIRVAKMVRAALGKEIKLVHYIAPTVWAYNAKRAEKIAKLYDLQLALLPIEKLYFEHAGVACEVVGHPIVEEVVEQIKKKELCAKYNISATAKILTIMPGSRGGDITKHAPVFLEIMKQLAVSQEVFFFVPTLTVIEEKVKKAFDLPDMLITTDQNVKKQFLSVSDAALVKSGTSAIEMAFYNIPTVVAYKMNAITYMYIKRKLNVRYASLINILLDREVFKEFIQGECRPELIIKELARLLNNGNSGIKKDCELFLKILGKGTEPSMQAANAVYNLLKQKELASIKN